MPNKLLLVAASVALIATPVGAQNNTTDASIANDANVAAPVDGNAAVDANLVVAPPVDNAIEPAAPVTSEPTDQPAVRSNDGGRRIPWGLLGLIGLIGLLGRRRQS